MSSTIPLPPARQIVTTRNFPNRNRAHRRPPSGFEYILIWFCVAIVTGAGLFAGWQFWHTDRIFSGVRVAGVPVGGETRASALLRLHKELSPYPLAPVFLEHSPIPRRESASPGLGPGDGPWARSCWRPRQTWRKLSTSPIMSDGRAV